MPHPMILAVLVLAVPFQITAFPVSSFPAHRSLAGLSPEQLDMILPILSVAPPENPPGPLNDTSAKLVNDAAHPWRSPAPNDMRGPCPGLNTLASHGVSYLSPLFFHFFVMDQLVSPSRWNCYSSPDHHCRNGGYVLSSIQVSSLN